MGLHCKHCGTSYVEFSGHDGFCCSGCTQVYALIKAEGMGDYYALQDRVGKPPVVEEGVESSLSWVEKLQRAAENAESAPHVELSVQGMTCVGCAWLVEKVSRSQPGVQSVRVDLETNRVFVEWIRGSFSLVEWAVALRKFGYVVAESKEVYQPKLSPLLWRTCLSALFAVNGMLLHALPSLGIDLSEYAGLLRLLEWLMAGLAFLVGASFFILPAYQSLKVGRWHYDGQIACGLLLAYIFAAFGLSELSCAHVSILVTVLLLARWLHRLQWSRRDLPVGSVDGKVLTTLQLYGLAVVLTGVGLLCIQRLDAAVAVLLVSSLYPLAKCVSYRPSLQYRCFCLFVGLLGMVIGALTASSFVAVVYLLAAGAICNFLFFRFPLFCSRPAP
ncbi:MAG: heavy metal translocating P-type ATPase metal-binding domain-containing protein [Opitutaceae bacterium]